MIEDEKNDDGAPEVIGEDDLQGVTGGRKSWPGTVTGRLIGNDTIVGVSNDTLFAGSGDKISNFNIGMPKKG